MLDAPSELRQLLSPEPVIAKSGDLSAQAGTCLREILRLFGADPSEGSRTGPTIVTFEHLSALAPAQLRALRTATHDHPLFICPRRAATAAVDTAPLAALTDLELSASDPVSVSRYSFAERDELWPFSGLSLSEAQRRTVSAFSSNRSVAPLVTTEHGDVFLKVERGKGIYVTAVPLPEEPEDGLLRNELEPSRFMALLPLLFFLRTALDEHRWRAPTHGATFMIDDPNLRRSRYGFLDLERLIEESVQHGFHTSIAMIPLDYRKTRRSAADLMMRHSDRVSLVMHGVDHVSREFEADVPAAVAEDTLAQGLARMEAHERRTGLRHARALTFPFGLCSATWMEAMRNVGFDAAIVSRSFPFATEAEIDDSLYELHPAQMTVRGFPVVNRFQAEKPRERLLFQALLEKPLIIYTHHTFFRDGMARMVEIADFVNGQIGPRWGSVDDILRANYQVKHREGQTLVRAFSNRISVPAEASPTVILKPGRDIPSDEVCTIGRSTIEPERMAEGLVISLPPLPAHALEVAFRPANPVRSSVRRTRLSSRTRRVGTELRDQLVLPGIASAVDARQRIGRRFR